MIWIKYKIKLPDRTNQTILRFDKMHEKNFELMYQDVINQSKENSSIGVEQLIIYHAYNTVKFLRVPRQKLQAKILKSVKNIEKHCKNFYNIRQIDFEIIVDRLPKKTFVVFRQKEVII